MFNFFTEAVENTLEVADSFISGEDISKKQVAKLISAGLTVASIASMTGIAVDVLEKLIDD